MKALKLHVERIVRRIQASEQRKDRFREELQAHLATAVAERCDAVGEAEALRLAIERLGPQEDIRRGLAATVPAWERILFWRIPWIGPVERWVSERYAGESPLHLALRMALTVATVGAASALCCLVPPFFGLGSAPLEKVMFLDACVVTLASVGVFLFVFFTRLVRRSLYGEDGAARSRGRAAVWALALGLAVGGLGFGVWLGLKPALEQLVVFDRGDALWLVVVSALAPVAALFVAVQSAGEKRRFEDWGRLELDG